MHRSSAGSRSSLLPQRLKHGDENRPRSTSTGRRSSSSSRDMGRSSSVNRRSVLGKATSNNRKPQTSAGPAKKGRVSSGYGALGYRTEMMKDPRPINDKRYKAESIRLLIEFLTENNYRHPISSKVLNAPSIKDFRRIFEFMYQFINPDYVLGQKHEEEVPRLMKLIGYPFTISKSSMFTVGSPHTWPAILAALSWMREILQNSLRRDILPIMFPHTEEDDFSSEPKLQMIFISFECSYQKYLEGADSFEDDDYELEQRLKKQGAWAHLDEAKSENRQLQLELEALETNPDELPTLRENVGSLQLDIAKMTQYNNEQQTMLNMLAQKESDLEQEIVSLESGCASLQVDLERKKQILATQEFSTTDVERINHARAELDRQIESFDKEIDNCDQEIWAMEMAITKNREQIEAKVMSYNNDLQLLKIIPVTAENSKGLDLEMTPNLMAFHNNPELKLRELRSGLNVIKMEWKERVHAAQDLCIQTTDALDQVKEMLSGKEQEISLMEARHKRLEENLGNKKQMIQLEKQRLQAELDEAQAESRDTRRPGDSLSTTVRHLKDLEERLAQREQERLREESQKCDTSSEMLGIILDHIDAINRYTKEARDQMEAILLEEKKKHEALLNAQPSNRS